MTRRIAAALALVFAIALASPALAQFDDHLKCYKIKDPLKLKGIVDLDSKQFGVEAGCKIGKAQLFCVPVTKKVIEAANGKEPIDPLDVFGPPEQGDRICYKIVCPKPYPPGVVVTDQFGNRPIENLKPFLLCTPAFKGTPPPVPCKLSGYPTCAGECPNPADPCLPSTDGTASCVCPQPCSLDAAGLCGGDCPNPGEICQKDTAGNCSCGGVEPTCEQTYPQCDGPCPTPGEICKQVPGTTICDCQPEVQPCDATAYPQCNGVCPNPADICVPSAIAGDCHCQPPTTPCQGSYPQCNGLCPNPTDLCVSLPGTTICECVPFDYPCQGTYPQCNGLCPNPTDICTPVTGTNICECLPDTTIPCDQTAPACNGACAVGSTCVSDPTLGCRCQ